MYKGAVRNNHPNINNLFQNETTDDRKGTEIFQLAKLPKWNMWALREHSSWDAITYFPSHLEQCFLKVILCAELEYII